MWRRRPRLRKNGRRGRLPHSNFFDPIWKRHSCRWLRWNAFPCAQSGCLTASLLEGGAPSPPESVSTERNPPGFQRVGVGCAACQFLLKFSFLNPSPWPINRRCGNTNTPNVKGTGDDKLKNIGHSVCGCLVTLWLPEYAD